MATIPTYYEIAKKLEDLTEEHKVLGKRYDQLTAILRKKGKDAAIEYWQGLKDIIEEDDYEEWETEKVNASFESVEQGMKEALEWDEEKDGM